MPSSSISAAAKGRLRLRGKGLKALSLQKPVADSTGLGTHPMVSPVRLSMIALYMSRDPILSPEIINIVMSFLDKQDVKSCTLVSKLWRSQALCNLYTRLNAWLCTEEKCMNFMTTFRDSSIVFSKNSEIATRYVKTILFQNFQFVSSAFFAIVMKIFPNIIFISLIDPRFAELTFSINALYASPPKSPVTNVVSEGQNSSTLSCGDSGSAFNPLSIDLDRTRLPLKSLLLYFQACSYSKLNNVSTVLTTLQIFSEIEFFQVDGCLWNDLEKQKSYHNHSQPSDGLLCDVPRLRHVLFKTDNPRRTSSLPFFQMLHQSSIPCLTTISVQHFSVDECRALGEILKACGSRLLKVCLEISLELMEKLENDGESLQIFNLSHCVALRQLNLSVPLWITINIKTKSWEREIPPDNSGNVESNKKLLEKIQTYLISELPKLVTTIKLEAHLNSTNDWNFPTDIEAQQQFWNDVHFFLSCLPPLQKFTIKPKLGRDKTCYSSTVSERTNAVIEEYVKKHFPNWFVRRGLEIWSISSLDCFQHDF